MIYLLYNSQGKILQSLQTTDQSIIEAAIDYNQEDSFLVIEKTIDITKYYVDSSTLIPIQEAPTDFHVWDWETKTYIITSEQIQLAKDKTEYFIDSIRKNLALQPIDYDSKALDADAQAQANINGKLQEIFAREAINSPLVAEEMFWKDADNIIHTWTNQNDYKLWLQGLVIAISSRNTSLYATAWSKKAEVEALTDINDIINYDINTGW